MGAQCGCSKNDTDPHQQDSEGNGEVVVTQFKGNVPFNPNLSTEDIFSVPHFVGPYADIRPLLDYKWHKMYQASRMEVQDQIVAEFCAQAKVTSEQSLPWVVFTAGAMGAGKGFVRKWMNDNGYWPLENFVIVDPDAIRQVLPEWKDYVAADAESAGDRTQKESGLLAEILGYTALRDRRNVIFDGSLRNGAWYISYFQKLRQEYPGIRIMILHVVADREAVLKRAEERGRQTGRYVPQETLISSMEATPKSVGILAPYADFVCRVENIGKTPTVVREPDAPKPPASVEINWHLIKTLWKNIDMDGDGVLSTEEIETAIALGVLTEQVVKTIDTNGDGSIDLDEVRKAKCVATKNTTVHYA